MKEKNKYTASARRDVADWLLWLAPRYLALCAVAGVLLRVALLCLPVTVVDFSLGQWLRIFFLGALNDAAFAVLALAPAFLIYLLLTRLKYHRVGGWCIEALLVALWAYACFWPDNILGQYSKGVLRIGRIVATLLLAGFSLRLLWPRLRKPWRMAVLHLTMFLYVLALVFDLMGEWFFWAEFGVRYNFVAVDYLVYTHEVIGNIMESYPIVPLFAGVLAVAALIYWLGIRRWNFAQAGCQRLRWVAPAYIVAVAICCWWLHFAYWNLKSSNAFVTELQENGCYDFTEAFRANRLDYAKFYQMLPQQQALALKQQLCGQDSTGVRSLRYGSQRPETRRNIVLIMVESLSASYMQRYGNTDSLTPNLDALAQQSLVFDSLYATGNRSVRGLEAVTLSLPPSAGESLVKRPEQPKRFSSASVLADKGYDCFFIYGGNSYFDNMGPFFSANGYRVVDSASFLPSEVSFKNIWGACDGDSYRMALRTFDDAYRSGRPFYGHIMTISNHRPFTYPEVDGFEFAGNRRSRAAGVKYTDFAIGQFLRQAAAKPWFDNTLFVIVADHCASSAGKTSLPLDKYHIPAIVYAPGLVDPQVVDKVCSQIDLVPTVLALMGLEYDSRFAGRDILDPDFTERALIATYQDLAYYRDGILTVLSPVRRVVQYAENLQPDGSFSESRLALPVDSLRLQAQALYQWTNTTF